MKTILIIEDSEQNLYLTRFILEQSGYRVLAAQDGPSGIESALKHRPTLILLDIQLPGMDGYQVATRLRDHAELRRTPIVAVTSYAMTGDRERVMEAGCTGYLEKPINPATFVRDVELYLAAAEAGPARRVLVVDDLEPNREYLKTLLEADGWTVACADNGADALHDARQNPPVMVVSDILMPGMDGFSLCREWRRDPDLAPIPFVFYTATYTDERDQAFGLSLGADAFLLKPMEPAALLQHLRAYATDARRDAPPSPAPPTEDAASLREYNAVLVRKLEDKMLQVESLNRELESRVRQRTLELENANSKLQAFGQVGTWTSRLEPTPQLHWSDETCRIFGIAPQDFDGRIETFFSLVHPDDLDGVRAAGREVWSGRRRLNIQHRILRPDASLQWVHQEAELVPAADGKPPQVVGVVREITETRLLEEQLRQSQKMEAIGRLAGGVAHDFNNVLTIITGHASFAATFTDLPPKVLDSLRHVESAAEMASTLTRQLLAFSRRQAPQLVATDLNRVVHDMTRMLTSIVGKEIHLYETLVPTLPPVLADPSMLEQVVMNLVVNARDAMHEGGQLHLATSVAHLDVAAATRLGCPGPGTYACVSVADTGCGIEPRNLPRIFEPFFTTKSEGLGTGLGLAVVYGIVEQHHGHIAVQSRVGSGTTFTVYLPAS